MEPARTDKEQANPKYGTHAGLLPVRLKVSVGDKQGSAAATLRTHANKRLMAIDPDISAIDAITHMRPDCQDVSQTGEGPNTYKS